MAGAAGLAALAAGCARPEPADLVLLGGKIVTVDDAGPEAHALAARGGKIVALGEDAEVRRYVGARTEVIELGGRLALPGFIESHGHFTGLGERLLNVRLADARSWDECIARVAEAARAAAPGEWILGRGWHQEKWDAPPAAAVDGYPTHDALSQATPDNPVLLTHASGHGAIANARALELAGVGADTPDPPGGTVVHDARGRPTGVLLDNAKALVQRAQIETESKLAPEERERRLRRIVELADRECLSKGVTSFQDAGSCALTPSCRASARPGSDFDTIDALRRIAVEGKLGVRLWEMLGGDNAALRARIKDYRIDGDADGHFTVRAIKRAIDGALGTHTAWLLAPYSDQPETSGLNTEALADLEETAAIAAENGFQLCVHAIGDRGNRETLDIYERTFARHPEPRDRRWRIEHAQHLDPGDVPRFKQLGVIASMQTVHCTSDAPWVPLRLGAARAAQESYLWRTLLDSGVVICNGTDAPVEDVDPIANFYDAVTRRPEGHEPFLPDQRMTRTEALRAATRDAAYAAFEEPLKGTLTVGKLADIVVLSADILTVPEERIRDARVDLTVVGGRVRYRRTAPAGVQPH